MRTFLPMFMLAAFICQTAWADDVDFQIDTSNLAAEEQSAELAQYSSIELVDRIWSIPGVEQAELTFCSLDRSHPINWGVAHSGSAAQYNTFFGVPTWMRDFVWPRTRELFEFQPERQIFSFSIAGFQR